MTTHKDDNPFNGVKIPEPGTLQHPRELKISLLGYRKSSLAGMWLLVLPLLFAATVALKYRFNVDSSLLNSVENFFNYLSGSSVFTYLIPIIFVGLPLLAMTFNFLAICHFASSRKNQELLVTIKYRPLNIAVFLFSFVVFVYFLLPDALP